MLDVLGAGLCAGVLVFAFVIGAIMASFITCVAWRTVAGESPWKGRSHCDSCGHALGILDLIPVVSWIASGGKCRYCHAKITARCVVAEVLLGLVFAAIVWFFGISLASLAYCALACILLGLSFVDLDTLTIPNGFILAGIVVWALSVVCVAVLELAGVDATLMGQPFVVQGLGLMSGPLGGGWLACLVEGLIGAVVITGIMLAFSLVFAKFAGKSGLGGGDLKLLFMCGLFLGLPLSCVNLFISCVVGLVFAGIGLARPRTAEEVERDFSDDDEEPVTPGAFPFGPAIAASCVITLFAGPVFLTWYLGLLL
ncbi:MAG: prepilin peptidase [Coriobacteriia bacterium]|nr:prepilin peptidase [Coriobacteriia bacterium]